MEFVRVTYPTRRLVFANGKKCGFTNKVFRINAGTHMFDLGKAANCEPVSQDITVAGTTELSPLEVTFTRKK